MAKKVKFPLMMADGAQVRTLEELREHFDLAAAVGYYTSGKLLTWLRDRYYEGEAEKVAALDISAGDFKKRLCEIFGAAYEDDAADSVDLEAVARRDERLKRLRIFTADDEILAAVDSVAFSQEDLADLLDKDVSPIYLCGELFVIPSSKENVTYIGVNNPKVKPPEGFFRKGIVFQGVRGAEIKSVYTTNSDYFGDLPNDVVEKAAESGNIKALLELRDRYHRYGQYDVEVCNGSPRGLSNPDRAAYWHRRALFGLLFAAENGDIGAQYKLGALYMWSNVRYGGNVEANEDRSNYWYRSAFEGYLKSAENGDAEAQYKVGILFAHGYGTDKDLKQAIYWLEKAAEQGTLNAMDKLRRIYADKESNNYDNDKSEYWENKYKKAEFLRCKKSAEEGDAHSQSILGDYYAKGMGTGQYPDEAERWYKLALSGFQKAADQGDARAQEALGDFYFSGDCGVPQDKRTAFTWYKKAAEQGNNSAMKRVGDCYKAGEGVEQSDEESMRWYEKAAGQGNVDASRELYSAQWERYKKFKELEEPQGFPGPLGPGPIVRLPDFLGDLLERFF
jgi:TPR repeat protein